MIIEPKIRNNVCLTAHPSGCTMQVKEQIEYVKRRGRLDGPQTALIIGSSNGYGLAARIVAAFGCCAATVGVLLERPGKASRPATAGWYNTAAFERFAETENLPSWSINGDAFSDETKTDAARIVKKHLGSVDLVVYSIAAPRRLDPHTKTLFSSSIKPIGKPFTAKTVDFHSGAISEITAPPASPDEIDHTVKVMGGEDWTLWVDALLKANALHHGAFCVTFSYIGPEITSPIYRDGTIGMAKKDLEKTSREIQRKLDIIGGHAFVSINKALVSRASAVIPAVPLYISLLYRVMKQKGIHEGCIEQMYRLFKDFLYSGGQVKLDHSGRIRLDDWEMREDVQAEVRELWNRVNTENIAQLSDIEGFREEFLKHHGFGMSGVDYSRDVEAEQNIPSIST
jgi:enoyl-[acyl-carrier protein] reductase/trans-2-enoyl-CoA reductase (NAD+)